MLAKIILIPILLVVFFVFSFLCYKKAPPTMAIIVTGFGLSKPKVVIGRGVFVIPIIQRADRLNMRLLKVDVKTPDNGVKNQEGVSLWLDSVVTVQVFSENSTVSETEIADAKCQNFKDYIWHRQQAAISNFLGMSEEDIAVKINDVLQGNLREIVSEMTIADILTNRKQMALSVLENARPDLAKMGLEIVTFNVQDIKDARDQQGHDHGVIEAIGVQQEEIVKRQAEIARAEAARDIAIAKADADRIANEKQVEAQTAIARRNNEYILEKARLKAEADKAQADANAAGQIQDNLRAKEIREAEVEAEKAAEAEKFKRQQEAEGIKMVGEAEAEAIRQKGLAEAEAMKEKAEAYKLYNSAAMAEMLIKVLPDVAKNVAQPLSSIGKVSIFGGDASGVTGITGNVPVIMAQTFQTIKEATGIDMSEIVRADSLTAKTDRNIKIEGLPTGRAPEQKPEAPVQPKAEEAPTQSKRPEMFEKQ